MVVGPGQTIRGSDGQYEASTLGQFRISPGMTVDEMRRDLSTVNASLQFAPENQVAAHVARLMVRTKLRTQGEAEANLLAETLVMDLRHYPADVVGWACDQWPKLGNVFFPSWAELRALCERRVDARRRLKKALEYYIAEAAA